MGFMASNMNKPIHSRYYEEDTVTDEDWSTAAASATITASATPHSKGSWTAVIDSAPFDVGAIVLILTTANAQSGTDTAQLCDIGLGAASSEVAIVKNLPCGQNIFGVGNSTATGPTTLPISIPQGERISMRAQATQASDDSEVLMFLYEAGQYPSWQYAEMLGVDLAASSIVAGAGGSWEELESSIPYDFDAFMPFNDSNSLGGNQSAWNVGIGAASSEVQIWPAKDSAGASHAMGIRTSTQANESVNQIWPSWPVMVPLRAGDRLAIRENSGTRNPTCGLLGLAGRAA